MVSGFLQSHVPTIDSTIKKLQRTPYTVADIDLKVKPLLSSSKIEKLDREKEKEAEKDSR